MTNNKNKAKEKIPRNISISDLLLVDGFKRAMFEDNKQEIERILFENGVDVSKTYEIKSVLHRNLRGQPINGPMLFGYERLDKQWQQTGAMSKEALAASSGDLSMQVELLRMSREGFNSLVTQQEQQGEDE